MDSGFLEGPGIVLPGNIEEWLCFTNVKLPGMLLEPEEIQNQPQARPPAAPRLAVEQVHKPGGARPCADVNADVDRVQKTEPAEQTSQRRPANLLMS